MDRHGGHVGRDTGSRRSHSQPCIGRNEVAYDGAWSAVDGRSVPGGLAHRAGPGQSALTDVTAESGIDFHHRFGDDNLSNIVEGTGAGAVFFDYDGDGWLDIYLLSGCWTKDVSDNRGRKYRDKLTNRLYRNQQDGTFEDVTEKAGVGDKGFSFGWSAADFDNDGDLDLYVLQLRQQRLLSQQRRRHVYRYLRVIRAGEPAVEPVGALVRLRQRRRSGRVRRQLPEVRQRQVSRFLRRRKDIPGRSATVANPTHCTATTATARSRT